ncbi:3D domain-containing protein [Clostridium sp.]|uniref:3D domain-containing protein n=1 Tax=Clostridium sp. TaxID=1506 RepID=UPI002629D8A6|nr:3D domain-containing protein [Clostridium sp.]
MVNIKKLFSKENRNKSIAACLMGLVVVTGVTVFSMRKTLNIVVNGEKKEIVTYKGTVQGALHDNGIKVAPKDKVKPSLGSKISKNETITINTAVNLSVESQGKELKVVSAEDNVCDMLKAEGIAFDDNDKILPGKYEKLKPGMNVKVVKVDVKKIKEVKPIEFTTEVKKDNSKPQSYTKVLKDGQDGEKEVTRELVYENGKEVSNSVVQELVVKEPVNKEVVKGTNKTQTLSRGGESINFKKKLSVKSTAYTHESGSKEEYTASGVHVLRNPRGYSTIAVDPNVIPLGSKVYVEGYGYAIAADTGGAIKGNKIDLYFNTEAEVSNWGVRNLDIYILN